MRPKHTFLSISLLFLIPLFAQAQNTGISGIIYDAKSGETLVGVNVSIENTDPPLGTVTDIFGDYTLQVPAGEHTIRFSFVGYAPETETVSVKEGETLRLDMRMEARHTQLDQVVVSGSQYEKRVAEETVSVDVIQPYMIKNTNTPKMSEAIEKVSGVSIVDGQVSMRGGSGYSYGAGSRVQVLVDEMPMLTGDFGEMRWEFVPMEIAENVEVIKGASSVMYGSGAMNGVINIRTGYAKSKPETEVMLYNGFYFSPKREELNWWKDKYYNNKGVDWWHQDHSPGYSGVTVAHRRKIANDFDLVVGTGFTNTESYLKDIRDQAYRFNIKTRYRPPQLQNLSVGVNFNGMFNRRNLYFFWRNPMQAYDAFPGTISYDKYSFVTVDPHLTYRGGWGLQHKVKSRYYNFARYRPGGLRTTNSNTYYNEYQLQKQFDFGLTATGGIFGNFFKGQSFVYNDTLTINSYSWGGYAQLEYKYKTLSLVAGLRYENSAIDDFVKDTINARKPLVGRFGLNYGINNSTFLRASVGQGYRIPSIVELFASAQLGDLISLFANPDLKPEYGWNMEVGIKKGLRLGDSWQGYLDLALFWMEYQDLTEFNFKVQDGKIGFQTQNVGDARIAGFEVTAQGDGKVGSLPFRIYGGYTYNYPADLTKDTTQRNVGTFLSNFFSSMGKGDSTLLPSMLNYRYRHMARLDVETDIKQFTFGVNLRYNSHMDNIDAFLDGLLFGNSGYRQEHNKGSFITDFRAAYHIGEVHTFSVVAKNVFNKEYFLRPGLMEAPANLAIQYRLKI